MQFSVIPQKPLLQVGLTHLQGICQCILNPTRPSRVSNQWINRFNFPYFFMTRQNCCTSNWEILIFTHQISHFWMTISFSPREEKLWIHTSCTPFKSLPCVKSCLWQRCWVNAYRILFVKWKKELSL